MKEMKEMKKMMRRMRRMQTTQMQQKFPDNSDPCQGRLQPKMRPGGERCVNVTASPRPPGSRRSRLRVSLWPAPGEFSPVTPTSDVHE